MKLTKPLLVLGIALAPAIAQGNSRTPLANRDGRPAVGNIGQRGRVAEARVVPKRTPHPLLRTIRAAHAEAKAKAREQALRARPERPVLEVKPLMTPEEEPAVGNVVKGRPYRRASGE